MIPRGADSRSNDCRSNCVLCQVKMTQERMPGVREAALGKLQDDAEEFDFDGGESTCLST